MVPDRCGHGEGPDGCGSVQVVWVECRLGTGPEVFSWARNGPVGVLNFVVCLGCSRRGGTRVLILARVEI